MKNANFLVKTGLLNQIANNFKFSKLKFFQVQNSRRKNN